MPATPEETGRPLPAAPADREIYTVTRLNREARAVIEGSFPALWVRGELSNLARPASGHMYFSLKDAHSQVRAAMFKGRNRHLKFTPENGMQVTVRATVSLYEGRGEFQIIVEAMEPAGEGDLQRAFEALKRKLQAEGLFDETHKKPIPAFPHRIGVITSPTGAAVRDIITVLRRRFPRAGVIIYPAPVQGSGAAEKIARAIALAGERAECDVLILARGGGSLEDLWEFNAETVARALFACPLPVVTGIGHEIDFTIADFTADRRAPTPSAAAELVTPNQAQLAQQLAALSGKLASRLRTRLRYLDQSVVQLRKRLPHPARIIQGLVQRADDLALRLNHGVRRQLSDQRARLSESRGALARHNPAQMVRAHRDRCDWLGGRLGTQVRQQLALKRSRLDGAIQALNLVSPLATLERGYAIVTDQRGRVILDAAALKQGDPVTTRFARGQAEARIIKVSRDD